MKVLRWLAVALSIALVGAPLVLPFAEALFTKSSPDSELSFSAEGARLLHLAANTVILVLGGLGLALPVGVVLALLFFRTDLPAKHLFVTATLFSLFIPLPLIVSAWQALIGSDGFFPLWLWGGNADRPWSEGLFPAIWVHALAGLPWVILIVGMGLRSVETELEEEALLASGSASVLWWVTLPRCRGAIAAAALWLAIQIAADISVTDVLLVPTFAEEIHAQFTMGGPEALARTIRIALPGLALIWLLLLAIVPRLERSLPPLQLGFTRPLLFRLNKSRWILFTACSAAGTAFLLVPLASLVWKVGLAGSPRAWSAAHASRQFVSESRLYGLEVFESLIVALATGVLAAGFALVVCWASHRHPGRRMVLLAAVTVSWALPAPLVGIGAKETIMGLVHWCPYEPLTFLLYDGPSSVPIVWVHLLRFFPFAVAILWPAVRLVPTELREAAVLEGTRPWQELLHVYWPMTRRACLATLVTVAALCLGEVGAAARVETPGWETFAKLLFDRMHYGVDTNVAALALVLLVGLAITFGGAVAVRRCLT